MVPYNYDRLLLSGVVYCAESYYLCAQYGCGLLYTDTLHILVTGVGCIVNDIEASRD